MIVTNTRRPGLPTHLRPSYSRPTHSYRLSSTGLIAN